MIGIATVAAQAITSPTTQIESGYGVDAVMDIAGRAVDRHPGELLFREKSTDYTPFILMGVGLMVFVVLKKRKII